MANQDIRTSGYILRRTNYGEADRILNIITPEGKISAIAKGARKEKSKLAGGIEMFSLVDLNIHQGKTELGLVTSAKMVKFYSNILKDFRKMELASACLKRINKVADSSDSAEYFDILDQSLAGLNEGVDSELVESWFLLNLTRAIGEEINLYRDYTGKKLAVDSRYNWSVEESAFFKQEMGDFGTNEIKMLRLMVTTKLKIVSRVKVSRELISKISQFTGVIAKI